MARLILGPMVRYVSETEATVWVETDAPCEVELDGERVWPQPDSGFPPSAISTLEPNGKTDVVFASCRVALPHEPPYTLRKDEDPEGREIDSLYVLARQMLENDRSDFPEAILMLGDQIYADEVPPQTLAFIEERREGR